MCNVYAASAQCTAHPDYIAIGIEEIRYKKYVHPIISSVYIYSAWLIE